MTKYFQSILLATCVLLSAAGAASAERVDLWDLQKYKTGAFATDCRNCEEDRGIDLECKAGQRQIFVAIPGAATEYGRKGKRTHVTIVVGGWKRVYRARMDYQGLIGYLPQFKISLDNPLFERLAAGRSMTVRFQGETTEVSLRGSARVLEGFSRACRTGIAAR